VARQIAFPEASGGQDLQASWQKSAARPGRRCKLSIASIMQTGLSALSANQQALKATSTNVANVNTTGYSRLNVQFTSTEASGGVAGVQVDIKRIANAYLAAAEMKSSSEVSSADMLAQFMDRAQGLLGDPSASGSVFATLDPVFASFDSLSVDPSSELRRSASLSDLQTLLSQLSDTAGQIGALRDEANSRAVADMQEANSLMAGIAKLNVTIQSSTIAGASASEAQTEQQGMLDRLSQIMDIRTQSRPLGGTEVRTTDGLLLVDLDAAVIGQSSTTNGEAYPATVMIPPRSTNEVPLDTHIHGGELKGLLRARDNTLVDLQQQFGEFAAGTADALNAAHNSATAVPAPTSLTGRDTGLIATDLLNFSGSTNIGIVDSSGALQHNYRVDFGTGKITDEAGTVTTFANSVGDFQTALNTALGTNGTATFSGGSLKIAAAGGSGLAVTDDPTNPAKRAGQGFAQTFGLNDLVVKSGPINYATGLSNSDLSGIPAGQTMTFALRNADGAIVRQINFTTGSGTTIASLRTDIDTALAGFAKTTFDANGRLTLTPTNTAVANVDVIQDNTQRGDTGLSMSEFFGLGQTLPAQRATGLTIRSDINANPDLLATAQADLAGVAVGALVLAPGDGRGALALEAAGSTPRSFAGAGSLTSQVTSVNDYAARLAGHAGSVATALANAKTAADSVKSEVHDRRSSEEGVNLDEELVNMTTYQQSYSAAARLITAAKDMYDIILQMV
jgi:flagellar hook-associated protein 1 FlgK